MKAAKNHLSLLKNKIQADATFAAKLHDHSPNRDLNNSRMSNRSANYSTVEQAVMGSPEYIEEKRKVYGQYRYNHIPSSL